MPEGPEVRRTTERLRQRLAGSHLQKITVEDQDWFTKQVRDDVQDLMSAVANGNTRIDNVECKGKFIWFTISDGSEVYRIHHTLGMSGTWRLPGRGDKKHRRLAFHTDNGEITYVDYRKFGTFKIFKNNKDALDLKLASLGPDILNEDVSLTTFRERIRGGHKRKGLGHKEITQVMMDQTVVSGIGNYIKAEALYMSKINPRAKVSNLTDSEIEDLGRNCIWVIKASYAARGATIRNYKLPNGDTGDYKFEFKVYAQANDPAGYLVRREQTADKRTTHWVPEVQILGVSTQQTLC
jgi:formamidopyrimidine-DNA glycosylase